MYTIAFDETSNFESLRETQKDKPVMLAGVVYNDTSKIKYKIDGEDVDPERERIVRYYEAVCKSLNTMFPTDLHVEGKNGKLVEKTKKEIRKTLGEFIKFGTYRGKELLYVDGDNNIVESGGIALKREGSYQLIVLLKASEELAETSDNDIQRDDIASNLYLNMVREYLKKGVFFNLSFTEDIPTVAFNIQPRKLEKIVVDGQENYNKYGYGTYVKRKKGDKDKYYNKITDEGYYQALITGFSDLRKIVVDEIFTKSTVYKPKQKRKQLRKQAYMFLSDSVCSVLSFKIDKPYDRGIRKQMNRLNNPRKNMFFYYEGRDDYYDKAVQAYNQKDMFTALSETYNGKQWSLPEVKKYYRKKWYSLLEKKIVEAMETGTLNKTIEDLDRYRYSDNLEQSKLLYIFGNVEKATDNSLIDSRSKFKVADIGISAYTHTGNPQMAEQYFHKCMKYQDDIDSDDLQRIQIRYITTLNDLFAFERARDYALGLLGIDSKVQPAVVGKKKNLIQRIIEQLLAKEANEKETNDSRTDSEQILGLLPEKVSRPNMYKALSSLGQTYAFMKDPLAEYCFKKSISDIKYSPDSSITKSFLLHWYIEDGDEKKYRENALDYFNGRSDLEEQLFYLIEEGSKKREESPRFSLGYAMFVFIKAFYTFYKDDPNNNAVAEKLVHMKETVNGVIANGERYMKNHPWEIIFKYSAMLTDATNEKNPARTRSENKRFAKEAIGTHPEYTIRKILEFGDIELLSQELTNTRKIQSYRRKINILWEELFSKGVFSHRVSSDLTENEKLEDLKQTFTFMYH